MREWVFGVQAHNLAFVSMLARCCFVRKHISLVFIFIFFLCLFRTLRVHSFLGECIPEYVMLVSLR